MFTEAMALSGPFFSDEDFRRLSVLGKTSKYHIIPECVGIRGIRRLLGFRCPFEARSSSSRHGGQEKLFHILPD